MPVVVRLHHREREILVVARSRTGGPRTTGTTGSSSCASTPPALMSLTRSCTSKQPGRISSNAVGLTPYSSFGRPATAFSPMFGITAPLNIHTSLPSSVCSTRGAASAYFAGTRPSNMSGGSTTWSSTLMKIMSSTFMRCPSEPALVDRALPGMNLGSHPIRGRPRRPRLPARTRAHPVRGKG